MKTSLRKLRGITGHHRLDLKDKKGGGNHRLQFDEVARATQDMREMKNCYDGLLSAAAATANCAFEFSESLGELGANLLKRTALNDDEDSGRVLLMLGKVQFELQKLIDIYRSHVLLTISNPSESLLNELRTVEEMKRQCDGKRLSYEQMLKSSREKGRLKNSREGFSPQQIQEAREEYDQESTLFVFRLKSLRQGQSRSLLTQAARHHSAQSSECELEGFRAEVHAAGDSEQKFTWLLREKVKKQKMKMSLNFFRKGIKLLEAIEPDVKIVAEEQHIDYQFSGLKDYETGDEDDDGMVDGFDDGSDTTENADLSFDYGQSELKPADDNIIHMNSELDQLDFETVTNPSHEAAQEEHMNKSQPEFTYYTKSHPGSQSAPIFLDKKLDSAENFKVNLRRMSTKKVNAYVLPTPLDCKLSTKSYSQSLVPLSPLDGNSTWPGQLSQPMKSQLNTRLGPPPLQETRWSQNLAATSVSPYSDAKKFKRQAFSGPLLSQRPSIVKSTLSQLPRPPPRISELHELPLPPVDLTSLSRHSAPLARNLASVPAPVAARLPEPAMARSFSIPSRKQRYSLEGPLRGVSSPPLTPISLSSSASTNII